MKVICDTCEVEMIERGSRGRFIIIYSCSYCDNQVTVDWSSEGYEMIEEYLE